MTNALDDLPPHLLAEMEALAALPDEAIDFSDIPETTEAQLARMRPGVIADWRARRAAASAETVHLSPDVVAWFRTHAAPGEAAEARIEAALREHIARAEV